MANARSTAPSSLGLRRVYEAPFLDRPGRLPLWQGSKREEAGIYRSPEVTGPLTTESSE